MNSRKLKIVFVIRSAAFLNYHRETLKTLKNRGHDVVFILESQRDKNPNCTDLDDFMESMRPHAFTYDYAVKRKDGWMKFVVVIRRLINYRRFLVVRGTQSEFYLRREYESLSWVLRTLLSVPGINSLLKTKAAGRVLYALEGLEPRSEIVSNHLKKLDPDVVVISPKNLKTMAAEYLKEAKRLDIRNVFAVLTWDNLTTKCFIHIVPDKVLVWNENQAAEVERHHIIRRERITITGAPPFDAWFALPTPTPRRVFCETNGLNAAKPIIAYLGTSRRTAPDESWLVREVRDHLDKDMMQDVQIIMRPHPGNSRIYLELKLNNMILLPRKPITPHAPESLQLFYDTLYHSEAVVEGVNNSGIIEAILARKPVIALITDRYREVQEKTEHFQDFVKCDVLERVEPKDLPGLLKKIIAGGDSRKEQREEFIRKCIRHPGLQTTAGEMVADEIEAMTNHRFSEPRL